MPDNVTTGSVTIGTKAVGSGPEVHLQKWVQMDGTPGTTEYVKATTAFGTFVDVRRIAPAPVLSVTAKSITFTSQVAAAANATRRMLILMNTSTERVYIMYGATASEGLHTFYLGPGDYWEMPPNAIEPGVISYIGDNVPAAGFLMVTEQ